MKSTKYCFLIALLLAIGMTRLSAQDNCTPFLSLEGQVSNKITPENLVIADRLKVRCVDSDLSTWTIVSFKVVRVPKKGDPTITVSKGAGFSKATIDQLKVAKVDDMIFFEDIMLINQKGEEKTANLVVEVY